MIQVLKKKQRQGLQAVGAILAGYLTIAILLAPIYWMANRFLSPADLQQPLYLLFNVLLICAVATAGGFVVVQIAPRQGRVLAILLAILMMVGSFSDVMTARNAGRPIWSGLLQLVAMPAAVIAGSRLNQKR